MTETAKAQNDVTTRELNIKAKNAAKEDMKTQTDVIAANSDSPENYAKTDEVRTSPKEIEAQKVANEPKVIAEGVTGKKLKKVLADDAKNKLRCPYAKAKLKFGQDGGEYDVCDECPLLEKCLKAIEALKAKKAKALVKKEKSAAFTRNEAIGIIIKASGINTPKDDIIEMAINLVKERTELDTSVAQMQKYYSMSINFLKGYESAEVK